MNDRAADFTGSIPIIYDHGLGPIFFAEFADDIARRVVASAPKRVLEIAAGPSAGGNSPALMLTCRWETTVAAERAHNVHIRDGVSETDVAGRRAVRPDSLLEGTGFELLVPP
jgi:hypothetical protein